MDWRSVLHTGGVAASADGTTEGKYDPAVKVRKGGRILVKGLLDIWTALTTSLVKGADEIIAALEYNDRVR